jgi:hypothetical protein
MPESGEIGANVTRYSKKVSDDIIRQFAAIFIKANPLRP